jgi:preprotein translocase subunit YajC
MQSALGAGDEIVTIGGLYGTVTAADDETVTLEISPGVTARYARGAVARVITPKPAEADSGIDNTDAEKAVDQG